MADKAVTEDAKEEIPMDLETSPAQAAGKRTRRAKPASAATTSPTSGVTTRRTSARKAASSENLHNLSTSEVESGRGRATKRQTALRKRKGQGRGSSKAQGTRRAGLRSKKSDAEDASTSEAELDLDDHDDSDSDPTWTTEAPKPVANAPVTAVVAAASAVASPTAAPPKETLAEPLPKVPKRNKPKTPKAKGARAAKGSSKSAKGKAFSKKKLPQNSTNPPEPSIDLPSNATPTPESLQISNPVISTDIKESTSPASQQQATLVKSENSEDQVEVKPPPKKKAAQVLPALTEVTIEGNFKTGDYIIAVADKNKSKPPIWRIEGKSLLQRFEPIEVDGMVLYRNVSSYSAWNPLEQSKYTNITVRIHSNSRAATVVEVIGISDPVNNGDGGADSKNADEALENLDEKYEVYLQTLLSHVLDPNFLAEVYRENDEYFINHLKVIHSENENHIKFLKKVESWSDELTQIAKILPEIITVKSEDGKDCESCNSAPSTHTVTFSGSPYKTLDLTKSSSEVSFSKMEFAICESCSKIIAAHSNLYHYKYHTYQKCKEKVMSVQNEVGSKESHVTLEQCLQDDLWVNKMYSELQNLWSTCKRMR